MIALLLADIHANLAALEAVLASAGKVDAVWVMGDTVGYGPEPGQVLALLHELGPLVVAVAGNHDRAVATGEGLELFNPYAAEAARLHRSWLSVAERDLLASLPLTRQADGFTLCHGSLRDPLWEYVTTARQAQETLSRSPTPGACNGHTHVPALFRYEGAAAVRDTATVDHPHPLAGRVLVNPGSVGQPRDGDPRAAYALLDTASGTITFRRTSYDVDGTQRRIRERRLPPFLADRLAVGR